MRKVLAFVVLFLLCAMLSLTAFAATDTPFVVMSYNILQDSRESVDARSDEIKTVIGELSPDVLGFQECRTYFKSFVAEMKTEGYETIIETLVDDIKKEEVKKTITYLNDIFLLDNIL